MQINKTNFKGLFIFIDIVMAGNGTFEIHRLRVQISFWPLADVVLSSPEFNFSATLVNSQLVCLLPVGILNLVMFIWILIYRCLHWSWKAPMGSGQLSIHTYIHVSLTTCIFLAAIFGDQRRNETQVSKTVFSHLKAVQRQGQLFGLDWNCIYQN